MGDINFVERVLSSLVSGNTKELLEHLKSEEAKAQGRGNYIVAQKYRQLIASLPNEVHPKNVASILSEHDSTLYEKSSPNTSLDEVILENSIKNSLDQFFAEWDAEKELNEHGLFPTNKILLFGPPGTGKTKLATAIAAKLKIPLILVRLDELVSSYLGKTGKNVKEIFDLAKRQRVIIFLDEIDTLAKFRDDKTELGELKRIVAVLLQNIDLLPKKSLVIGATNHEHLLDKAIWRRFQLRLNIMTPTSASRERLIKLFLSEYPHLNTNIISELTSGMNGAYIEELSNEIRKNIVLSKNKPTTEQALVVVFNYLSRQQNGKKSIKRQSLYKACAYLNSKGFPLKEIARLSGLPYTTLRDNVPS